MFIDIPGHHTGNNQIDQSTDNSDKEAANHRHNSGLSPIPVDATAPRRCIADTLVVVVTIAVITEQIHNVENGLQQEEDHVDDHQYAVERNETIVSHTYTAGPC